MSAYTAIALLVLSAARPPRLPRGRAPEALLAPGRPSQGPGQVTYVTSDSVYLDRGAADGLEKGSAVQVLRGGKPAGTCTVAVTTEHGATCVGTNVQAGDRISVVRRPEAPAQPLAPVPDARELAARLELVEAAPTSLVDFEGQAEGRAGAARVLFMGLSHTTFANLAGGGGPYQLQRLDVSLNDLKLWRGLHVSADATVLQWSRRHDRFGNPLRSNPQLFVRRLEASWHEADGRVDAALGRIWARHLAGIGMLDGAQASVHTPSRGVEGGAFGGLLPNPLTLAPTLTAWTAGAYAAARLSSGSGADAIFVQPELRLSWAVREGLGGRFELGAAVNAWVGRWFDAHAQAQVAAFGAHAPSLDFARVDLGLRPAERLRFSVAARYRGNGAGEVLELGAPAPGARGLHADGTVFFDGASWSVGVTGGYARDVDSALAQGHIGPQVNFPRLLGHAGGVSLGYAEELGWLPGRSAWLGCSLAPHWRFRALARLSWFMQGASAVSPGVQGHELGAALSAELRFTAWLWLRLNGSLRQPLEAQGGSPTDLGGASPWRAAMTGGAQLGVEL